MRISARRARLPPAGIYALSHDNGATGMMSLTFRFVIAGLDPAIHHDSE
jgi:hypothetical protein